jgi:TPR repeat protein
MFWWMKSANQGNTRAQFNIGLAYAKGDGVKKKFSEAIRWFRKSLQKDKTPHEDTDKFYENLMRLAKLGDPVAQYKIGHAFENGLWFPKNEAEAFKWYLKAAEQNNLESECSLGFVYLLGIGTEVNPSEAIKWWTKSAMQGDWLAQLSLGLLYSEGMEVKKNDAEAYAYLSLAASSNDDAARMLAIFETNISSHTLSMGQKRLAEIQKSIETKNKN